MATRSDAGMTELEEARHKGRLRGRVIGRLHPHREDLYLDIGRCWNIVSWFFEDENHRNVWPGHFILFGYEERMSVRERENAGREFGWSKETMPNDRL